MPDKNEQNIELKRIINQQRRVWLREFADKNNSYCFFASMYEVKTMVDSNYLLPRVNHLYEEWQRLGWLNNEGRVRANTTGILNTLQVVSSHLGLTVKRIIANPDFVVKLKEQEEPDYTSKKGGAWKTHVESFDGSAASNHKAESLSAEGWANLMAITFSTTERDELPSTNLEEKIIAVTGIHSIDPIHIRIMGKYYSEA